MSSKQTFKYLVKYPDEEGRTCYSQEFDTPEEAYKELPRLEGIVIQRITIEEEFDYVRYDAELQSQMVDIQRKLDIIRRKK